MSPRINIDIDNLSRRFLGLATLDSLPDAASKVTKVVVITSSPTTLRTFFQKQLKYVASCGFDVSAVASPGPALEEFARASGVAVHELHIDRRPNIIADLTALLRLTTVLRRLKPTIVQTHTPKAGLLGMLAGLAVRAPIRIYTVNGLVFESRRGLSRHVLMTFERIACMAATDVLCVSPSLLHTVIRERICTATKAKTLGRGSSHGVDVELFAGVSSRAGRIFRSNIGIPSDALVLGYVGRVVNDKGIVDLATAWGGLREQFPNLWLLLCGRREAADAVSQAVMSQLERDVRVKFVETALEDMPAVYSALSVLVLPSYREGLPNVALECGAMGVPIVATRIGGCVDAIIDEETGLLVPPKSPSSIQTAVTRLLCNEELRERLCRNSRVVIAEHFADSLVNQLVVCHYRRLLFERRERLNAVQRIWKRVIDLIVGVSALLVCLPLFMVLTVVVGIKMGWPVLFTQCRHGRSAKDFQLYKFRTMQNRNTSATGVELCDEDRLTPVGRFLRKTSLDEIPQLWNVVKGEMSLVGPRPLLPKYLTRYSEVQRRRLEVKPGITGVAQVLGRNALSWNDRFLLDVWYVDNHSILLDVKVLLLTVIRVFRASGVSAEGHATMPEFLGNDSTGP